MEVFVPREPNPPETRVAMVPEMAKKLIPLGIDLVVESGAGEGCEYPDALYEEAGAKIAKDRKAAMGAADIVLRVSAPEAKEILQLKKGAMHVSFLDPFNRGDLLVAFAEQGVTAVSLEMMPRTTLAQKMDALSSQANLAGYFAVIAAAEKLSKIMPMMMTPGGTISPARVFIIGVGVSGLQAIATAKRLGARVEAFDTRPVVEEQVKSLGAKFVKIDLGETGQTKDGYAVELTAEQLEMQRQGMKKVCGYSDIVITTAKLFGRKAPVIVTKDMVAEMQRGSVVVDLAAEGGGNVEGTVLDQDVTTENGVHIIGKRSLEGEVPRDASLMYSSNLFNFLEHFWEKPEEEGAPGKFKLDLEEELLKGCVMTHGGEIVHERFKAKEEE